MATTIIHNTPGLSNLVYNTTINTTINNTVNNTIEQANTFGDSNNYSEFESDGTYIAKGDATVWIDIDYPIIIRTTGTGVPSLVAIAPDITVPQWEINDFTVCEGQEMVHAWKEGTAAHWHCHIITNGTDVTNRYLRWEIKLTYANVNSQLVSNTITSLDLVIPANTPDKTHLILSINTMEMPGMRIGTHVYARLKRIATSNIETYPAPSNDPWCSMLQMHIECDTFGSRDIASK